MHTVKVGWVGQTFALAKSNESDSGGRKSRIRRSKEERKAMLESFIKKYQSKNDGNFPSLRLAHKEVGGSFYTVREIVREIIQENRVLGPAKSTTQEMRSDDQFSHEHPLGSIATEPQIPFSLLPNESQPDLVYSLNADDSDERVRLNEEKHGDEKELKIINGSSRVNLTDDEFLTRAEPVLLDKLGVSTYELIDFTNVEVETFPLKLVTEGANSTSETVDSAETLDENQKADVDLRSVNDNSQRYALSSQEESALEDGEAEKNNNRSSVAVADVANMVESKVTESFADSPAENLESSTRKEGIIHDTEISKSSINEECPPDALVSKGPKGLKEDASLQAINITNGVPAKSMNGALREKDAKKSFRETEIRTEPANPSNGSIPKGNNPPLDRMNLESWEVASRSASKRETNPLLAIFKAFIVSFVKFWSE